MTYEDQEKATIRKPAELYHIWCGDSHWYYTSSDITITYDLQDYIPAAIRRGAAGHKSNLEVSKVDIQCSVDTAPFNEFLAFNPIEIVWIQIFRIFRDQDPYEAEVIFSGQVEDAKVQGIKMNVSCVGLEYIMKQEIPFILSQPLCPWVLYGDECGLNKDSYDITDTVTVSADGLTLTGTGFSAQDDQYYTRGWAVFGHYKRFIVDHTGNILTLRFKFPTLVTGNSVTVYAGCDRLISTCMNKFNNVINFGGDPYVPMDNPAYWDRNRE